MLKYLGCHENIVTLYDVITMPYVISIYNWNALERMEVIRTSTARIA